MIRDPLLNQIALNMHKAYLLSFKEEDFIDCPVLSFDEWVKANEVFKENWID